MLSLIALSLLTFLISYNSGEDFNERYIWIPLTFLFLGVVVVLGILTNILLYKHEQKDYDKIILEKLEEKLKEQTDSVFGNCGYTATVGPEFTYIEFKKNAKKMDK